MTHDTIGDLASTLRTLNATVRVYLVESSWVVAFWRGPELLGAASGESLPDAIDHAVARAERGFETLTGIEGRTDGI